MSRYIFAGVVIVAGIFALSGCSSKPPKCDSPETRSLLSTALQQEANLSAIVITVPARLWGENMFQAVPAAMMKAQQGEFVEAFSLLEKMTISLPDGEGGTFYKSVIAAAKTSTFEILSISTVGQTENKSSCQLDVKFTYGFPSVTDSRVRSMLDMFKTLKQERTFDVFRSEDGVTHIKLNSPK